MERRNAVIVAVIVLLLALGIRLRTYQRYLPFVDYSDELNMYMLALDWRDTPQGEQYGAFRIGDWLYGYPPLYIWISMAVQQTVENQADGVWVAPGSYIHILRLLSVAAGVLTTGLIFWIGYQMAGLLTAAVSGGVWAFAPIVVELGNLAIPDSFVYPAFAAAFAFALVAWIRQQPAWVTLGTLAALIAIYLKYTPVYALIPPAIVLALLFARYPRRTIPWIVLNLVLIALTAAYLLLGYGATNLANQEADAALDSGFGMMFDLGRNWNNFLFAFLPLGVPLFLVTITVGIVAYLISRRRGWRRIPLFPVGLLLLAALPAVPISASFTFLTVEKVMRIRHVFPVTIALVMVSAFALTQLTWTLRAWSRSASGVLRFMFAVPVMVALPLWSIPALVADITLIARFSQPHTQYLLWKWSDANIPADGLILMRSGSQLNNTWNRPWSGYDGVTAFQWWFEDNILASTPDEYLARGIAYIAATENELNTLGDSQTVQSYLNRLTLIKRIVDTSNSTGSDIYFFKLKSIENSTDLTFGDQITLVGYDLNAQQVRAGETLSLRLYWRASNRPTSNFSMYVHFYAPDHDQPLTQHDGALSKPNRPTLTWDDPSELHIGSDIQLTLPSSLAPGSYQLAVGVYDYTSGVRLLSDDGLDHFVIPISLVA